MTIAVSRCKRIPGSRHSIGPVIEEYYAGSEGNGMTFITSTEWLAHPGSVGTAKLGVLHVVDDDGNDVPPRSEGAIYFEGATNFEYHDDPEKTAATFLDVEGERHSVPGDFARLELDGTMTLLGRGSQCINSGGEKIYPEEVESALKAHPKVFDALVLGVDDERWGQKVAAVVQPRPGEAPTLEELVAFCQTKLARYKAPRELHLVAEMPREDTGKLYKRRLRETYLKTQSTPPDAEAPVRR